MGSSAVIRWTGIVKLLGRAIEAETFDSNQDRAVAAAVTAVVVGPALPHAAWKKLVIEHKVPKALAQLCVRALQRHPHSAALGLASLALDGLLQSATLEPGSRLASATLKQLQDAGLLQHLPALMTHAAQDLAAAAAASGLVNSDSTFSAAVGPGQSTEAAAGTTQSRQMLTAQRMVAFRCAGHLLFISSCITSLWPGTDSIAACLQHAPALVQLVLVVFEAVHKLQQEQQEQQQSLAAAGTEQLPMWYTFQCQAAHATLPAFCKMSKKLKDYFHSKPGFSAAKSTAVPAASSTTELLRSPELHRCFTIMTCAALAAVTPVYGCGSSGRGKGGGFGAAAGSRSSGGGGMPAGLQEAATKGQGTPCKDGTAADVDLGFPVTPLTSEHFEQLGVGHATMAMQQVVQFVARGCKFEASQSRPDDGVTPMTVHFIQGGPGVLSRNFTSLKELAVLHHELLYMGWHNLSAPTSGTLGRVETSLLLSLLLLQWVDALPAGCTEVDTEEACQVAALMTSSAGQELKAARLCSADLLKQQQQQQQQTHPPAAEHVQQATKLVPQTVGTAPLEQIQAEVLALLTRLCKGRLQLLLLRQKQQQQQQQPGKEGVDADPVSARQARQRRASVKATVNAADRENAASAAACTLGNAVPLFADLCCVDAHGSCSIATQHTTPINEAVVEADPKPLSGAPAVAERFLHSQQLLAAAAAHAEDIVAIMEGSMRLNIRSADSADTVTITVTPTTTARQLMEQQELAVLLARAAGPGSAVQRQCHSFLATLLKLSAWQISGACYPQVFFAVAEGAAAMLASCTLEADSEQQQEAGFKNAGAEQQLAIPFPGSAAASLLPSLVIIGRYLLHLHAGVQGGPDSGQQAASYEGSMQESFVDYCLCGDLATLANQLQQWLQAHSEQLVAAGYGPQAALQELRQLGASLEGAVAGAIFDANETFQRLQLTGLALCSLPVPCLCNNPCCSNTSGVTELGLVSGRSCICGGCRVARYCSRTCHRVCWKQHKPMCATLAAAAAAASPELPAGSVGAAGS